MSKSDSSTDLVDVLTTWTTSTAKTPFEVGVFEFNLVRFEFGKDGDGGSGSVNSTLRLGSRNTLDSVNSRLELKGLVRTVKPVRFFGFCDFNYVFIQRFKTKIVIVSKTGVHTKKIISKDFGFFTTGG